MMEWSKFLLMTVGNVTAWYFFSMNSLYYIVFKYNLESRDLEQFLEQFPSWFAKLAISYQNIFESSASPQAKISAARFNRFMFLITYLVLNYLLILEITDLDNPIFPIIILCIQIVGFFVALRFGHSLIKKKTESSD